MILWLLGVTLSVELSPFHSFHKEFNKSYKDMQEYAVRRDIFMKNYQSMVEHNQKYADGEVSWWMEINEDMDLTSEEWLAKRTGGIQQIDNSTIFTDTIDERIVAKLKKNGGQTVSEFNWLEKGKVSPVKSQGQCGSCAAFAAIAALESCFTIKTGQMVEDLSEQHILDCAYNHHVSDDAGTWGAYGCSGAFPNVYYDWLMSAPHNQEEASYPYTSGFSGKVSECKPDENGYFLDAKLTGMHNVWYPEELDMEELVQINPVATAVQVTSSWSHYGGGVLESEFCCDSKYNPNCPYKINHAVTVVGYGHQDGKDYWLIKNSWGTRWGDEGYVKLRKGKGHCAVGTFQQTIPHCQ